MDPQVWLEDNEVSFEHLPSGIDTMSVVIASATLEGRRDRLMQAVARAVRPDSVFIEDELALVAVVGRGMVKAKGTAARVCDALARADINIRMIDQASQTEKVCRASRRGGRLCVSTVPL